MDQCLYLGLMGVHAQVVRQGAGRVGEQHVLDETDGAGGAFDVGQYGPQQASVLEPGKAVGDVVTGEVGHPALGIVEQAYGGRCLGLLWVILKKGFIRGS